MVIKRPKYSGKLASPISLPPRGLLNEGNEAEQILREQWKKLDLLFDLFKIDRSGPGQWALLALELSLRHVPGMKVASEKKAGRPKTTWDIGSMRHLVSTVDELQKARGITLSAAIKLAKKANLKFGSVRALERRYYEAKDKIAKVEEDEASWDQILADLGVNHSRLRKSES